MSKVKKLKNCYKILSCDGSYTQYSEMRPGHKNPTWIIKYSGKIHAFCVCLSKRPSNEGEIEVAEGQGNPDDPTLERRFHKTLRVYDQGLCQEACEGTTDCDFSGEYEIPPAGEGMSCRPGGKINYIHAALGVIRPGCGHWLRHAVEDIIEGTRDTGRCPDGLVDEISCKEVD